MAKTKTTPYQERYILDNYLKYSSKDIGLSIGLGQAAVAGFKKRNNLIVPPDVSRRFAIEKVLNRTSCSSDDDNFIKSNFIALTPQAIADHLKCSETKVRTRLRQLGLKIPEELRLLRIQQSRISKGNVPANKGKKQVEYMSPEAIERTKSTRFKKGNIPNNCYHEIGKITIRHDHKNRSARQYKYICLAIGKWKPLHTHIWEEAYGKIPKNHCLWFKDGDSLNVTLDNLECITRAENIKRNANLENPTDNRIAFYMATTSRVVNKELQKEILKHPELIQTKRTQLLINRKIKQHGTKQTIRP